MKILVANLGSTSFKYRLLDMADERQLARGGVERIGSAESPCFVEIGGKKTEQKAKIPDHAAAVRQCLTQLTDPATGCLKNANEVAAIGFKAVHGGRISGVQESKARAPCFAWLCSALHRAQRRYAAARRSPCSEKRQSQDGSDVGYRDVLAPVFGTG